ncbi:MAG: GAF domain-containing protein [Solirubrobacterales bacterium]
MATVTGSSWHAVDPTSDRINQARALRRLYEGFHEGREIDPRVRAVVAQSWRRSEEAGLDPAALPRVVADENEVSERWKGHPLFPVLPILRQLLSDATTQSGHMLVISDADGILLWIEGHRRVIEATENMHLVCGADWSEAGAGTNAMGTAVAVDHPVQIFSAEHFNRMVHPWQCSGAPIHDPETGEIIAVIDLTGHVKTAHPHTLSLVGAAAGMAEVFLRQDLERRVVRLKAKYLDGRAGVDRPAAILGRTGHVLTAVPDGWLKGEVKLPATGTEVKMADGSVAELEPIDGDAGWLIWSSPEARPSPPADIHLRLLELQPVAEIAGAEHELGGRHGELLLMLALSPEGISAERLTLELYGEQGRPESLRAEISRLRSHLGPVIDSRPYRFSVDVRTDFQEVEQLISTGRIASALERYRNVLLPESEVSMIRDTGDRLDGLVRAAVIGSDDPVLISRWCATGSGRDDLEAAEILLTLLAEDDAELPGAIARAERLRDAQPLAPVAPSPW